MAEPSNTLDLARCKEIGKSCTCYSLRRAARAITRLYDEALRPTGLRITQFSLLMAARLRGPISVTKLASLMAAERTTVTRNLTVLEKKGLIAVEAGNDRRERQVSLTSEGEEALLKAIPFWEEAQERITNELGEERIATFRKDLAEIASLARPA